MKNHVMQHDGVTMETIQRAWLVYMYLIKKKRWSTSILMY